MASNSWKQQLGMGLLATVVGTGCSDSARNFVDTSGAPKVAPNAPPQPLRAPKPLVASFQEGTVGFASFSSEQVRKAAMDYPVDSVSEPEAPISLTADDGTGLVLEALDAAAVIEGPLAFTELRMRFRNPQSRTLEGRFQITLPDGASVSRLAMRMTDGWREAEVVELQAARRAYEDFLHRKQDPMLLEKEAGNQFRARIFPIPADGVKEVILSFSQELRVDQGYTLPLRGLPAISELSVRAQVAEKNSAGGVRYQNHQETTRGSVPTKDFHVALAPALSALRNGNHIVARVSPTLSAEAVRPEGITILFDTSASRAPGFAKQVRRLGTLVAAIGQAQGNELPLNVAAFDQEVTPIYSGKLGDFGDRELTALLARRPLGASDLGGALAWAGQQTRADRLLIVGDAVATAGEQDLGAQAKALPASIVRIDVLLLGGIRDLESAGQLVRGTRTTDGVVLQEQLSDEEVARRFGSSTTSLRLAVPGAKWVWPASVDGVQPGDEVLVFAGYEGANAPASFALQVQGAEAIAAIPTTPVPGPLLERAAMQSRIAALQGDYIAELAKDKKAAIKAQIVGLSTKHRVLSDFTALLVLETENDYARFGIDRRALADILTVDEKGLSVVQRKSLVIASAPQLATKAFKDEDKKEKNKVASEEEEIDDTGRDKGGLVAGDGDGDSDRDNEDGVPEAKSVAMSADESPSDLARSEPPPPPSPEPRAEQSRGPSGGEREMPARRPAATRSAPGGQTGASIDDVFSGEVGAELDEAIARASADKPQGPPALTGKMAAIHEELAAGNVDAAVAEALRWRSEEAGNVMALVALGESLEAAEKFALAARAYGSIIDLFPSRADLRRFASARLARLEQPGLALSIDSLRRAAEQRPDHLSVHRLLAYALVRAGRYEEAFAAIETGLAQNYPEGRFAGGVRILQDDLGIIAAAWIANHAEKKSELQARLKKAGAVLSTKASTRFVLNWETDANDVDFHIYDGKGGHAYYSDKTLPSGGELYADVTTGYGPECFTISGAPKAFPYNLQIHYYSRGPMGYGMGQVEVLQHDGKGQLKLQTRPFVVMNDGAYLDLGSIEKPL